MNQHLTEEQFTDILLGLDENPAAQAHLSACTECQQELTNVEEAIGVFREASADWSRQRVASIPAPQPDFFARFGLSFKPVVGLAVAAVVAIAISVPSLRHENAAAPASQQAVQHKSPVPTADQIKADNELLEAINDEISAPHSSVQQAGFSEDTRTTLKR